MSPLYVVELLLDITPYTIVFEPLPRDNRLNPPNMNPIQQIEWKTMHKNKYPVRVCSINGLQVVNGYAVADILEWRYGGTTLSGIWLNGYYYNQARKNVEYWFPELEKPEELVDGSIRVCMNMKSNKDVVILSPLDSIPFMDKSGVFMYDYTIVAKEIKKEKEYEYLRCNIPVTLYQFGDKFKLMIDNTTMQKLQIDSVITFHNVRGFDGDEMYSNL